VERTVGPERRTRGAVQPDAIKGGRATLAEMQIRNGSGAREALDP
jgi:hypothetical protein